MTVGATVRSLRGPGRGRRPEQGTQWACAQRTHSRIFAVLPFLLEGAPGAPKSASHGSHWECTAHCLLTRVPQSWGMTSVSVFLHCPPSGCHCLLGPLIHILCQAHAPGVFVLASLRRVGLDLSLSRGSVSLQGQSIIYAAGQRNLGIRSRVPGLFDLPRRGGIP